MDYERIEKQISELYCDMADHEGELRLRKQKNGSCHYVKQCQKCGAQIGNALKYNSSEVIEAGPDVPFFDETISDRYENFLACLKNKLFDSKTNRNPSPAVYKSEKQIKRDNLIDEINLLFRKAGDINEQDFLEAELIRKLREMVNIFDQYDDFKSFSSENEIEEWLINNLSTDFYFYRQVPGKHISDGVKVKIDFLIFPKKHLINHGFSESFIGVEVKFFHPSNKFGKKSSRSWWQTISYLDCEFFLKDKIIKPKFCLLFSNLSFEGEIEYLKKYYGKDDNDVVIWRSYKQLANHARVGSLEIYGRPENNVGWGIHFANSPYFQARINQGQFHYILSTQNLVGKVRIGNF